MGCGNPVAADVQGQSSLCDRPLNDDFTFAMIGR